MSTLIVVRRIALLIQFLKQELKPGHRFELGDGDLATLLNEVQPGPPQFKFTGSLVAELRNGKRSLKPIKEAAVLRALQELLRSQTRHNIDVSKDLPQWVEDQCASGLREALRESPASSMSQGEHLADKITLLSGAWSLFVAVPPDRNATHLSIFRFALCFRPASSTHMSVVMISRKSEWRGIAYMNGSHLYMHMRDVADTKAASLITNLPVKQRLKLSGVAISVAPESQLVPNPALVGSVCFAERWDATTAVNRELAAAVARLTEARSHVSEDDVQTVREEFCKVYPDKDAFSLEYPSLFQYMTHHRINGQTGFPLCSLHVVF